MPHSTVALAGDRGRARHALARLLTLTNGMSVERAAELDDHSDESLAELVRYDVLILGIRQEPWGLTAAQSVINALLGDGQVDAVVLLRAAREEGRVSRAEAAEAAAGLNNGMRRLTRRELAVLRYLATGATNQEIAAALNLSVNTVKKHVARIFGKLHVRSRSEAAICALATGVPWRLRPAPVKPEAPVPSAAPILPETGKET